MEKVCNDAKRRCKEYGVIRAKKVGQRLDDLSAATCLAEMKQLPGRCHELTGDRNGKLALDLDGAFRLVFEPDHNPIPKLSQGELDWSSVTRITIMDIENYHD